MDEDFGMMYLVFGYFLVRVFEYLLTIEASVLVLVSCLVIFHYYYFLNLFGSHLCVSCVSILPLERFSFSVRGIK